MIQNRFDLMTKKAVGAIGRNALIRHDQAGTIPEQRANAEMAFRNLVLLVDDIVDTGLTLSWLVDYMRTHNPRSVRTYCFLDKPSRRLVPVPTDYIGFPIEDVFVVGYGLDYQKKYRELPFISCVSPKEILV